jgi:hypothetical protein
VDIGPGYWKLNTRLLKDEAYIVAIKQIIADFKQKLLHCVSPLEEWDRFKQRARTTSIRFAKEAKARATAATAAITERHLKALEKWHQNPCENTAAELAAAKLDFDANTRKTYESAPPQPGDNHHNKHNN